MKYYYAVVRTNSLYHHGVLGQKWGVRRYQNADGSYKAGAEGRYGKKADKLDAKAAKTKFSLLAQNRAIRASQKRSTAETIGNVKDSKGIKDTISNAVGYGELKTRAKNLSEGYANAAKYAKTEWGKTRQEARSFNADQVSKYAEKMQSASTGKKIVEAFTQAEYMKMPIKTLSGRETTVGKEMALRILTSGVGNALLDAEYRHEKRQEKKQAAREAKAMAKAVPATA